MTATKYITDSGNIRYFSQRQWRKPGTSVRKSTPQKAPMLRSAAMHICNQQIEIYFDLLYEMENETNLKKIAEIAAMLNTHIENTQKIDLYIEPSEQEYQMFGKMEPVNMIVESKMNK